MTEPVLIPKTEASVVYHTRDCEHVDKRTAYEMAREDAEELLDRRPAACVKRREATDDGPDARPPEVPA